MTPRQREILETMRYGPTTAMEVALATGKKHRTVGDLFTQVHRAGWTERCERKNGNLYEYVYELSDAGRKEIGPGPDGNNPFLWRTFKQPVAMGVI